MRLKHSFALILTALALLLRGGKNKNESQPSKERNQHKKNAHNRNEPAKEAQPRGTIVYSVAIQPSPEDRQRYQHEKHYWERQVRTAIRLNWITIVGAAVAGLGLFILWCTLLATNKGLEQSRDQFVVSQRAHVVLGNKDGKLAEFRKGERPIVVLNFYNTGPSAAVDFMINTSSNLSEPNQVATPELNRYWGSYGGRMKKISRNASIIAGESSHLEYLPEKFTPSRQQFTETRSSKDFRVSGIYIYCDIFGRYSAEYFAIQYLPPPIDDFTTSAMPMTLIENQMSDPTTETIGEHTFTPLHRCKQPGEQ
jgi:hypothetical protein